MERRNRKKYIRQLVTIRGIAVLGIVALVAWGIVRLAMHRALFGASVANYFKTNRSLSHELIASQTTIEKYAADEAELELLRDENTALKSELGRNVGGDGATEKGIGKGILATVLFPAGRSIYDTFVIDAGSEQGIRDGARVYAFGSVALGTITSVEENRATVQLYSASGRETSGTVTGNTVAMTLIGRGGGEYEIHMPRDIHFEQGQVIAEQTTVPHTLATIIEITADPRDPFQKIRAKAPINIQALKWVVVE